MNGVIAAIHIRLSMVRWMSASASSWLSRRLISTCTTFTPPRNRRWFRTPSRERSSLNSRGSAKFCEDWCGWADATKSPAREAELIASINKRMAGRYSATLRPVGAQRNTCRAKTSLTDLCYSPPSPVRCVSESGATSLNFLGASLRSIARSASATASDLMAVWPVGTGLFRPLKA